MVVLVLVSEADRLAAFFPFAPPEVFKDRNMFIKWYKSPVGAIISSIRQLLCHLFLFFFFF